MKNILLNLNYDYSSHLEELSKLICPEPNYKKLYDVARSASDFSDVLNEAVSHLTSGVYFIGLLLEKNIQKEDYFIEANQIKQFEVPNSNVLVVNGNLNIKGDLFIDRPLIVTGNLIIDGIYSDLEYDAMVAIMGNLECNGVCSTAWPIIGGNCTVNGFVYGYYNDEVFECLGTLTAKAVISEEHQFNCGKYNVQILPPSGNRYAPTILNIREKLDRDFLRSIHGEELDRVLGMETIEDFDEDE